MRSRAASAERALEQWRRVAIVGDESRSGHRRERNRRDELRIIAAAIAAIRVGPAPVEDVLAVAMRFRVQRHRADQLRLIPRGEEPRRPPGFGRSAARAMQRREILMRQQRQSACKLVPVVGGDLRQCDVVANQRRDRNRRPVPGVGNGCVHGPIVAVVRTMLKREGRAVVRASMYRCGSRWRS